MKVAHEEQCKKCRYWKNAHGSYVKHSSKFCHYMFDTGKRRVEIDGVCKSYKRRSKKDEQECLLAEAEP